MAEYYNVPVIWLDGEITQGRAVGNNAAWVCLCGEILLGPHEGIFPIDPCPRCERVFRILRGQENVSIGEVRETNEIE